MWESTSFLDVWVATPHKVAIPCNQQPAPGAAALAVQVPPAYQDFFLFHLISWKCIQLVNLPSAIFGAGPVEMAQLTI